MAARIAPIHDNVEIVRQGIAALGRLEDELYARPAFPDGTGSIGSHFRHILDHYQAFFSGLESGRIDYDARERDPDTETNRATARARAEATVRELTESFSQPAGADDRGQHPHHEPGSPAAGMDAQHRPARTGLSAEPHGAPLCPDQPAGPGGWDRIACEFRCRPIHPGPPPAHHVVCTLSWLLREDGYSVWFNRDERVTRKPAFSPRRHERSGVSFVAPTDAEAGGTWIGVNAFGVTVCLANRYGSTIRPSPSDRVSRGLLVLSVLNLPTQQAARSAVECVDLTRYEPFTLGIFETESPPLMLAWDGETLAHATSPKAGLLLTSSAVDQERVVASRVGRSGTRPGGGTIERRTPRAPACEPRARAVECLHLHAPARRRDAEPEPDRCRSRHDSLSLHARTAVHRARRASVDPGPGRTFPDVIAD